MAASPESPSSPVSRPATRAASKKGTRGGAKNNKTAPDLAELVRGRVPHVVERLVALMDSDNEKVAIVAAQELLNRAYGKAPTVASPDVGGAEPVVVETCIPKDPGDTPDDIQP